MSSPQPIPLRRRSGPVLATVTGTKLITPQLRRVHLIAPELFTGRSVPTAAWVRGFFPLDPAGVPGPSGKTGPVGAAAGPAAGSESSAAARAYTLVDFDPETGRFALDFVLHEHGPAARWAAQAEAGQVLRVAGPLGRGRVEQQHQRYFLAGDLTALPAIRQWLIALPATVAVQAHIWSPSSLEHQELPTAEGWNVAWHYGTEGNWADLAERGELAPPGWHPDQPDVKFFIAGEAGLVTRARRAIAMAGRPLPGNLHAAGYWRSGGTGDPAALERLR